MTDKQLKKLRKEILKRAGGSMEAQMPGFMTGSAKLGFQIMPNPVGVRESINFNTMNEEELLKEAKKFGIDLEEFLK